MIKLMGFLQYFARIFKNAALNIFYPFWFLFWQIFDITRNISIPHSSGAKYLLAATADQNKNAAIKMAYFLKFYDYNLGELQKFAKNKVSLDFCDGDDVKFRIIYDIAAEKSVLNDADILFGDLNLAENLLRDEE